MKFKYKEGFIPKYYKNIKVKEFKNKLKIYVCILFLINLIITPVTINELKDKENLYKENLYNEIERKEKIKMEEFSLHQQMDNKTEKISNILDMFKENILDLSFYDERISFRFKFGDFYEGEKFIKNLRYIIKKDLNYVCNLEENYYVFIISEG